MNSLRIQETDDILQVFFTDAKILDDARIQQIGSDLLEAVTRATNDRMLLNFLGVTFMSSAMIGKLVSLNNKCREAKVALKFCNISDNLTEVFKIMKLNKVFDMYKTDDKAIKSFDKKGWFG